MGKFGVQEQNDKSAVGWEHLEKVEKHSSQTDSSHGFGGKFGVQTDRVDKSAQGWDQVEKLEKHESQKDYKTGFGGEFGVQSDRVDKSAVGWDHAEKLEQHESQKTSHGFGGKFGVQKGMDKSAHSFDQDQGDVGTNYVKTKPDIPARNASNLRSRFENMAQQSTDDANEKLKEERKRRELKEKE